MPVAPDFGLLQLPYGTSRMLEALGLLLPNIFMWWDPRIRRESTTQDRISPLLHARALSNTAHRRRRACRGQENPYACRANCHDREPRRSGGEHGDSRAKSSLGGEELYARAVSSMSNTRIFPRITTSSIPIIRWRERKPCIRGCLKSSRYQTDRAHPRINRSVMARRIADDLDRVDIRTMLEDQQRMGGHSLFAIGDYAIA